MREPRIRHGRFARLSLEHLESRQVPSVTLHGGQVLRNVAVQTIYYGPAWASDPALQQQSQQLDGFLRYLTNSPYMDLLNQYGVSRGRLTGSEVNAHGPSDGSTFDDSQVRALLTQEDTKIGSTGPAPGQLYFIFTPPSVTVTPPSDASLDGSAGYHTSFIDSAGHALDYAVVTYPANATAQTAGVFQQLTKAASHELAGAVTDPDGHTGWFAGDAANGNEIGDLSNQQSGLFDGYTVAYVWSNSAGTSVLPDDGESVIDLTPKPIAPLPAVAFTGIPACFLYTGGSAAPDQFTVRIDWGDGQTSAGTVKWNPLGFWDVVGSNTYANPGFYTTTVSVTDQVTGDAESGSSSASVTQRPLNFTSIEGDNIVPTAYQPFSDGVARFCYSDPSAPALQFSATINWGDGHVSDGAVALDGSYFEVSGTNTYDAPGEYPIQVTIRDSVSGTQVVANGMAVTTSDQITPMPTNLGEVALAFTHSAECYTSLLTQAYQRYLGRGPDQAGLDYWVSRMQHGVTDEQIEAQFLGSPEYIAGHGNDHATWVQGMYQDLLGRAADPQGLLYWISRLNAGAKPEDIALGFAASAEREALRVGDDYQTYLGRQASPVEINFWVNQFQHGASNEDVTAGFVGSAEFYNDPAGGHGNTLGWLACAYDQILHRAPGPADLAYWSQLLV